MLVPPRPWVTWTNGGYLTEHCRAEAVRIGKHPQHREYLEASDKANHLSTIYHALDVLGSTPWRINRMVLDVAKKCWNENAEYPSVPSGVPIPQIPDLPKDEKDANAIREHKREQKNRYKAEQGRYSQRCDANYKILIADAVSSCPICNFYLLFQFKNHTIYFPHFLDFRGRAYPLPPYLNHIGNDLCRGLMLFDVAKPLGERGLKWLKIQVANLFGVDKVSFKEREMFVQKHLDDIFDSADNPLSGRRWWLKADSPWQCLATCIELTNALRSPNPTAFMSRLPIHQDGTCNGLQHYAALGGDREGAKLVNLIPGEKPSDVYTGVATQVAKLIEEDAKAGHPYSAKLNGHISRKVVKQTVMTNTYGVTRIGARIQVTNRLKELDVDFTDEELYRGSMYIVGKIFDSLGIMFEGARNLQKWLNSTARIIANSVSVDSLSEVHKQDLEWVRQRGLLPMAKKELLQEIEKESEVTEIPSAADMKAENVDGEAFANLEEAAIEDTEAAEGKEEEKTEKDKKNSPLKIASVVWTSPLGLPIVQPYWNYRAKTVRTYLQSVTLFDPKLPCAVDSQKQSTAFPPNYIHCLDASHMMLSAIACKAAGLEFAAVHDSYWTHASDVDKMNTILREAFVKLHSENLMDRLRNEIIQRYRDHKIPVDVKLRGDDIDAFINYAKSTGRRVVFPRVPKEKEGEATPGAKAKERVKIIQIYTDIEIPPLPARGDFNVEQVKNSAYFFH